MLDSSIIKEATTNSKIPTDVENFRYQYAYSDSTMSVKFPAFDIYTYDKNLFILLQNSTQVKFLPRWDMRPDYVSYDYYNTTIYWQLILYINSIYSIEEFTNLVSIYVPTYNSIFEMSKHRILDDKIMSIIDDNTSNNKINVFYKKYPLENVENNILKAAKNLQASNSEQAYGVYTREKTDVFTLTSTDLTNEYVDLYAIPANISSISLYLNKYSIAQRYGYDYVCVLNDNNEQSRISWSTSNLISTSNNMKSLLEIGDKLTIKYTISTIYKISDGIPS